MSGQPNRYVNSAEKFKNQYMDALNLRANVDDFNLQANKNFKATGTLPPSVTQMVDNRTTTEILADTEKLKLNIIAELKPVMNSGTASVVVQKIQTAPVNADGSFLVWVAQNIPEIVKSLRKKYALGIKGDAQDATNIVLFLSDMYSKIKDYTGTVKTYFDSVGDSKTGLKEGDLDALRREYEVIVARLKTKYPNYREPSEKQINNLISLTTQKIQSLYSLITSPSYKDIINEMQNINTNVDLSQVNGLNDIAKAYFGLLDELPSVSVVRALYKQLDRSLENKNKSLSINILQEIYNLFPERTKIDQIKLMYETQGPTNAPSAIHAKAPTGTHSTIVKGPKVLDRVQLEEQIIAVQSEISVYERELQKLKPKLDESIRYYNVLNANGDSGAVDIWEDVINKKDRYDFLSDEIRRLKNYLGDLIRDVNILNQQPTPTPHEPVSKTPPPPTPTPTPPQPPDDDEEEFVDAEEDEEEVVPKRLTMDELNTLLTQLEQQIYDAEDANDIGEEEKLRDQYIAVQKMIRDRLATGSGLKKKRRGRPKGSGIAFKDNIDHTKGIQPVKKYHPFGKYFVNSHKLNHGNVLSIRSKSGTNVREYPSRIVSPHMASIVKTIIGGGVPSYNDMNKLTEDEKDYLYKVSKRAEFADKISIPTPSKDKMEKDIHEFEVCKGEIMAGNDSKELIKKFKLLIIRLSRNGTIPKREATEVMQELLELGY